MKELIIIGARGFGREVYTLAQQSVGYGVNFIVKGFLDDNANALDNFSNYPKILSSVEDYQIKNTDVFICALGSIKWSVFYVSQILSKGGEFINLIHKEAALQQNVKLGIGVLISKGSIISNDVSIGNFTHIMSYCILGHDVKVDEYSRLGDYVFLGGFTKVEDQVFIAVRATVLDRLIIGSGAVVGAGSVVLRNVKPNSTVFGNPAKKLEY